MAVIGEIVHPQRMRLVTDCVVAALASLTGHPYDAVAEVADRVAPAWRRQGLVRAEIHRLAAAFGVRLRPRRRPREDDDEWSGVALIDQAHGPLHAVVWWAGRIYDPQDGNFYLTLDAYLANYPVRPRRLSWLAVEGA